jgi:hypothetical protein
MKESRKKVPTGLTQVQFPESCHVCLIYENEEQRQKIVSEYIAIGLERGEIVRYFTDQTSPETVRSWLKKQGIEISEAEEKGDLGFAKAEKAYCPDGQFEPEAMINRTMNRYEESKNAGYKGSRACGEMSWALKGIPGSDRLLEYEVLLNNVSNSFPHSGMCQYDARLFDGATLFKILQIHPYIIAQGQLVQNPYYISYDYYSNIKNN